MIPRKTITGPGTFNKINQDEIAGDTMQLLSSTLSVTRFKVEGRLADPVVETLRKGLSEFAIREIDSKPVEKSFGFTRADLPFTPDFSGDEILFGTNFVFSLRIDKKRIPAKVVKKEQMAMEAEKMARTGRQRLSTAEKKEIKELVVQRLLTRVPAVPNVYDIVWDYENETVWFFSGLKEASEVLESLFSKAFGLTIIKLFPFTWVWFSGSLSHREKDLVKQAVPTLFVR